MLFAHIFAMPLRNVSFCLPVVLKRKFPDILFSFRCHWNHTCNSKGKRNSIMGHHFPVANLHHCVPMRSGAPVHRGRKWVMTMWNFYGEHCVGSNLPAHSYTCIIRATVCHEQQSSGVSRRFFIVCTRRGQANNPDKYLTHFILLFAGFL